MDDVPYSGEMHDSYAALVSSGSLENEDIEEQMLVGIHTTEEPDPRDEFRLRTENPEEECYICGEYLEAHHEDYNIELREIFCDFEGVLNDSMRSGGFVHEDNASSQYRGDEYTMR